MRYHHRVTFRHPTGFQAALLVGTLLLALASTHVFIRSSSERSRATFGSEYDTCIAQKDRLAAGKCLRMLATKTSGALSPQELESALLAMDSEPERSWCHEFLHYAGWSLYDQTKDFSSAFGNAIDVCDNGMRHGVAERFASDAAPGLDASGLVGASDIACNSGTAIGVRASCYHGIGHALMFVTDRDMQRALTLCDQIPERYRMACDAGVYMEVLMTKHVDLDGSEIPEAPKKTLVQTMTDACLHSSPAQQTTCFRYLGNAYFLAYNGDQRAFDGCGSVEGTHRSDCFWGLASTFVSPGFTLPEAAQACERAQKFGDAAYINCINGGITDVVNRGHDGAGEMVEYCDHVVADKRDFCYSTGMQRLALWYPTEAAFRRVCTAQSETILKDACETVAADFSNFAQ